jgi:two-component system KDP operon response regulator KdpE
MYKALVMGERPEACGALAARLTALGFDARPGPFESISALRAVFATQPDAIVFDADAQAAPRDLFATLVSVSQLPTLVIGAGTEVDELIWYLDAGASGYVPKPVSANAVAARLNSVLRRRDSTATNGVVNLGHVQFDKERRELRRDGETLTLTPTEFKLLEVLLENADRPCNQRMLLRRVWGEDFVGCRHYLRLYVGYLRSKLEANPAEPKTLITEWGVGYRLVTNTAQFGQPLPAQSGPQVSSA